MDYSLPHTANPMRRAQPSRLYQASIQRSRSLKKIYKATVTAVIAINVAPAM